MIDRWKEAWHAQTRTAKYRQTCLLTDRQNSTGHRMCSRCAYPDLILSTLAGQDGLVPLAPQPQVGVLPILVGRNVGVCPALCTMPQALPLFPSFLQ